MVPMFDPVPPNYYISVISDRWLHAETHLPISFKHLILPKKYPKPTPLLDLQPLSLSASHNKEFEALYANTIQTFNKIQAQVFQALYTSDEPAYLAIREHSPTKLVIISVSSRRQCRLAIDDLLTHCSADDKLDLFLNIELADLQPHLDHINDKGLVESLKHGIGYYHKALDKQDKQIVQRLFESGAIQVLVASKV
jgi:uncharacterized protein YbgA (DUF1722 family)